MKLYVKENERTLDKEENKQQEQQTTLKKRKKTGKHQEAKETYPKKKNKYILTNKDFEKREERKE